MADYRTLLVTTDLSDPSLVALSHAAVLADRFGSRLILVYVVEDRLPPMILAHAPDPVDLLDRHRDHAERALRRFAAEHLPGRDVEPVVRVGIVHDQIASLARERGADMIVMGMHGHGYLVHALAGSTSERVLHHAPCPVLVVPHS